MDRYVNETGNQSAMGDASGALYHDSRSQSACGNASRYEQESQLSQRANDYTSTNSSTYCQPGAQQYGNGDRQIIVVPPTVPTDQNPVPMPFPPGSDCQPIPYPPPEHHHHHGGLGRALGHIANFALEAVSAVHVGVYGRHGGFSLGGAYPYEGGYGYGGGGYGYGNPHRGGYCDNGGYVNVNVNRYDGGYNNPYDYGNYNNVAYHRGAYDPNCNNGGYYNPGGGEYYNPGGGGYYNPGGGGYYNPGGGYYNPGGGYYNPGGGYYNPGGGSYYNNGYGYGNGGGLINLMINGFRHGGHGFHGHHHH